MSGPSSLRQLVLVAAALVTLLRPSSASGQDTLDAVLRRAAGYAAEFRQRFSNVVAEEVYVQDIRKAIGMETMVDGKGSQPVTHRELRSDILMVRTAERYVEFRDVFAVNGAPVRDRQERLAKLFLAPTGADSNQIIKIGEESARYNIGNIYRNINTPALPLMFLEADQQPRFKFRKVEAQPPALASGWTQGNAERFIAAEDLWVVEYQEVAKNTVIRRMVGAGDMPSRGRFWIDPASGRVSMTELTVGDPLMRCTIDVSYSHDPLAGMFVPVELRERYVHNRDRTTTTGTATYGRIRRFGVQVDETIPGLKP